MDVDLLVASDPDNESKVSTPWPRSQTRPLASSVQASSSNTPSIRVADEILVDLMRTAGGIAYAEAALEVVTKEVGGVPIPFASARLLWRMKTVTHRAKDAGDLVFLRHWFAERGEQPPAG